MKIFRTEHYDLTKKFPAICDGFRVSVSIIPCYYLFFQKIADKVDESDNYGEKYYR